METIHTQSMTTLGLLLCVYAYIYERVVQYLTRVSLLLGKPPGNLILVQRGIARIAIAPPPFRQPGTLGHFIFGPN